MTEQSSVRVPGAEPCTNPVALLGRLKLETHDLRRAAERSGAMRRLLSGSIGYREYGTLLRNLHEIYDGLERALEVHSGHPAVAPIFFRALFRRERLENDLRQLYQDDWPVRLELKPAAIEYRHRLDAIAGSRPPLLVAHAYVRYLGDLTDGQIIHQLAAERLRLGEAATTYYQFGSSADLDLLVARFRSGVDAVAVAASDEDAIVAEAQYALRQHIALFEQTAA